MMRIPNSAVYCVVVVLNLAEVYIDIYLHPGKTTEQDINTLKKEGYAIISAARDPWYRKLKGKSNPLDPEYLFAQRENHLYLNLVDTPDTNYYHVEQLDAAMEFLDKAYKNRQKTLVHCNHGMHRSPSIVMLYMARDAILPKDFTEAVILFQHLYPHFAPWGLTEFIRQNWSRWVH